MKSHVSLFHADNYRCYLQQILDDRRERNPRYSLRAFARDLDTAPSLLSLVLHNKAGLSLEKAKSVAERLSLPEHEREYFVALVYKERSGDSSPVIRLRQEFAYGELLTRERTWPPLSLEEFAFYLKLSLAGNTLLSECREKLEVEPCDFQILCRKLESLGWLEGSDHSGWSALKGYMRTESFDKSESIRLFHQNVLELARKELHQGEVGRRFFHSTVFSLAQDDYAELCQMVTRFCQTKADAYDSRSRHDRIYVLGVQVLPVSTRPRLIEQSL